MTNPHHPHHAEPPGPAAPFPQPAAAGPAYPQYPPAPHWQPPTATKTNGLALAAFIMALLGISLPAAICGHVSREQIDRSAGMETNRWMATTAIIVGWIGVGLYCLLIVLMLAAAGGSSY
jgi:hypothetical protein